MRKCRTQKTRKRNFAGNRYTTTRLPTNTDAGISATEKKLGDINKAYQASLENSALQVNRIMDIGLEDHASKRQKVDDATAEEILMRISNGDISDGDFSDDELEAENEENIPANGQVTASTTTAALPARPDATVSSNAPAASTKAEFKWVKKDFAPSDVDCHYNPEVASTCQQPLVYFSKYFTEQIFEDLAEFTNRYVLQRDGAVLATTKEEIKIFFGMLMLMGVLKYPRVRMYWQTATRIPAIADSMGVKRFFKIRGALHISDANEERDPNSQDKFWKVRPLLEAVRSRCLQLVPLEQNSIDEQMVPFTGRIAAKQFVKGKPNPEGVKVFVRCSFDGLAHDFEFYQGKGTGVSKEHAHLGLGGSVVMRLVESLPKAQNIKCYMDNYFTSVKLFLELKKIGILASGTIRGNRLAGCVMKTDKEMKKEGRGSYDERVSQNDEVVLVRWQDNGTVNMASTHLGVGNIGTVRRWSESQKVHVDIDCPEVVLDYNKYMGGVDKLDFIMSLYPMRTRTKKWPVRVISHFASFALSNSWLEYLRDANKAGLLRKETLDMMAFQTDVANCLLNSNKPQKKRGRPSNDNSRTVKKKFLISKDSLATVTDVINHCRTFETLKMRRITPKFGHLPNVTTVASVDEYTPLDLTSTIRQIVREELTRQARPTPYEATPAPPPSRPPVSTAAAGIDDCNYRPPSPPRSQRNNYPLPRYEDRFSYPRQPANTYYDPNKDVPVPPPRQRNAFQEYNAYRQAPVCYRCGEELATSAQCAVDTIETTTTASCKAAASPHLNPFAKPKSICSITTSSARRQSFPAPQKLKIIGVAEEFGNREAERRHDVDESGVRLWRKKKESLQAAHRDRRSFRGPKTGAYPELEAKQVRFIEDVRSRGLTLRRIDQNGPSGSAATFEGARPTSRVPCEPRMAAPLYEAARALNQTAD
ncbi:hypothetical protein HPB51_001548 [Rhipicephalus microplus]|uniref:PiggyBac transposable element-derived protein domain-containing protein n=1 Tax=Rhipicephalus microplus TaxID=6941 RepID=A0A9J6EVZ5_RHIMP|nr:hypothetical protein HPB51_001548 [Rhipicephalus microplus]